MPLDVLLLFQSEAGDLEIEMTLLKAGATRSSGMSISIEHEPFRFASRTEELEDFFKYKRGRDKPSTVRTVLLTIAALILTATYEAAITPPSNLWQDNGSAVTPQQNVRKPISASTPSSPGQENNSGETHKAGTSILAE
ncbi:hypothetical protein L6164_000235 [Bauhinia variegata]|uniref:Uncharacterized protein n=1 Tax=Bauhinia variegata TaxID=167791 RepID=A0ACB9Q655_BAUVA|nr:hypothetical protein L6164_000235 [Bauhinia variegata]